MIYPDSFDHTLSVEKIEIMITAAILVGAVSMNGYSLSTLRCKMTDNRNVQSTLILGYT